MKKFICLLLALGMILGLCACGGNSNVKTKLCENVHYNFHSSWGNNYYLTVYEFNKNGSYARYKYEVHTNKKVNELTGWEMFELQEKEEGKYTIDTNDCQIVYNIKKRLDADGEPIINNPEETYKMPYAINEYTHELLFDVSSNGESEWTEYSSVDNLIGNLTKKFS